MLRLGLSEMLSLCRGHWQRDLNVYTCVYYVAMYYSSIPCSSLFFRGNSLSGARRYVNQNIEKREFHLAGRQ